MVVAGSAKMVRQDSQRTATASTPRPGRQHKTTRIIFNNVGHFFFCKIMTMQKKKKKHMCEVFAPGKQETRAISYSPGYFVRQRARTHARAGLSSLATRFLSPQSHTLLVWSRLFKLQNLKTSFFFVCPACSTPFLPPPPPFQPCMFLTQVQPFLLLPLFSLKKLASCRTQPVQRLSFLIGLLPSIPARSREYL